MQSAKLLEEIIMKIKNIVWETDGNMEALKSLPTSVDVPEGTTDVEQVSDWLSDTYGFLHNGFEIVSLGEVTVSLETLFNKLAKQQEEAVSLTYGELVKTVEDNTSYFDLKTSKGTPCMDGETCKIIDRTKEYILLQEVDECIPFKLSLEEFEIATTEVNV